MFSLIKVSFSSAWDQSEEGSKNPQSLIKVFDSVFHALECDCFGITPHFLWGYVDINVIFPAKSAKNCKEEKGQKLCYRANLNMHQVYL